MAPAGAAAGVLLGAAVAAAVIVVLRWARAADAPERRRLRWPALVLALVVAALAVQQLLGRHLPGDLDALVVIVTLGVVPFALLPPVLVGAAVDDERLSAVIRTTVVLSVLWTVLSVLYAPLTATLGLGDGHRSGLALVILAVGALASLHPVPRGAISGVADRLAMGPAVDGYALRRDYGAVLADRGGLSQLCQTTSDTVQEAWGQRGRGCG